MTMRYSFQFYRTVGMKEAQSQFGFKLEQYHSSMNLNRRRFLNAIDSDDVAMVRAGL